MRNGRMSKRILCPSYIRILHTRANVYLGSVSETFAVTKIIIFFSIRQNGFEKFLLKNIISNVTTLNMLESSSVQLKCYPFIIQQFTTFLFKKSCFKDTLKFYFLFAFTIVSLIEQSFTLLLSFLQLFAKSIFFLFNTFCCDNKHDKIIQ